MAKTINSSPCCCCHYSHCSFMSKTSGHLEVFFSNLLHFDLKVSSFGSVRAYFHHIFQVETCHLPEVLLMDTAASFQKQNSILVSVL